MVVVGRDMVVVVVVGGGVEFFFGNEGLWDIRCVYKIVGYGIHRNDMAHDGVWLLFLIVRFKHLKPDPATFHPPEDFPLSFVHNTYTPHPEG